MPRKAKGKEKEVSSKNERADSSAKPTICPADKLILSSAKPIKSWAQAVEDEEAENAKISKELQIQQWIDDLTEVPGLLEKLIEAKQNKAPVAKPVLLTPSMIVPSSAEGKGILSKPTFEKGMTSQSPLKLVSKSQDSSYFQNQVFQKPDLKSPYFTKPDTQYIWTMENGFFHKSPFMALQNVFPKGWFFKPWDLSKPQPYYRAILEATGSVTFKDFSPGKNVTEAGYSTAKIHQILSPSDWGTHLHSPKHFPTNFTTTINHCRTYTYWDYQQAWYNAFMYQNSKNSHSWLFYFNLKMGWIHFEVKVE